MMENYDCSNNHWLSNLYTLREKWCPTFSKEFFSGGVLSSQRSETANRSLKRRLHATVDFCDFYNIFYDVVSESRSKENGEDHRCSKGKVEMTFPSVNILKHAMSVYAVETFLMFEKEFIEGVWRIRVGGDSHGVDLYEVRHIVTYNRDEVFDQYIIRRWCKGIKDGQTLNLGTSNGKENVGCSSVWRMQMMRKMNSIITASQMNKNARAHCE
ncbi:hypothetical protein Cgig2_013630 [Carnegiea gigantea]|uniref:Protein FAR1-RELATED SEQUENCE n=1 Tax=Carnegiea gigantea TaxID=171969 RepID=A0A9Q1KAI4_9CARY|nr:hypothetical protein Cgig2_013630 [Carnegiea gigantea]